jgi:hypothetical protein
VTLSSRGDSYQLISQTDCYARPCVLLASTDKGTAYRGKGKGGARGSASSKMKNPFVGVGSFWPETCGAQGRNAGPRSYWNARGGQVFLTPAEHLLCRRQGELSRLSLNFRIVVAADLDAVAINAKSGSQRAAPRSHRPVGDGCVGVASPGRLKQNRDGRSFRPDGHPEVRSLEQGHVGSLDLIPETDDREQNVNCQVLVAGLARCRSCPPRSLTVPAPRGGPLLRGQHTSRLGQDHPREAPPVGDAAAMDVVFEVVALLLGEFDRAFLG